VKTLPLLLFGCTALLAQPLSFGVKGGVPLTDFVDTVSGPSASVSSATRRYIVGATVELKLPAGFGVEFDALYRRFDYNSTVTLLNVVSARTTGNDWEFPLLLKKRFLPGPVHPFIGAGVAFSKLSGVKQSIESVLFPNRSTITTSSNTDSSTKLTERRIRHLPVVDKDRLIGMVSIGDVVKAQRDHYQGEVDTLQTQLLAGEHGLAH
jgi:hypothetical protein